MVLSMLPPALFFWFLVHPFARFWRRLGAVWTYALVSLPTLALMAGLFLHRDRLLVVDYGFSLWLASVAVVVLVFAGLVTARLRRQLTTRIRVGLPELSSADEPGRLIAEGIYARIRHPRYVEMTLWMLAYALFANYLAVYVTFALSLPTLYLLVLLEERELRERFGAAYEAYCRRVPRFVPRRRPRIG